MDEDVLVHELVNSLAFEVEAITTDNVVKFTSTNGTPLNVKVRVRNKDEPRLVQRGLVSVPRLTNHITSPEKIRVISSDQTILSFNVYMEAELEKETKSKSRKRTMNFFKFGGCLGSTSDEEEDPYLPSSSKKKASNKAGSKSDSIILEINENVDEEEKLNLRTTALAPQSEKRFFGRCKPGGCLDPPFGEDKYPYGLPKTQPEINLKQSLNKVAEIEKNSVLNVGPRSSSKASNEPLNMTNKEEVEPKPILDIFARAGSLDHPRTSNYSNSIITYPPELSSSEMLNINHDTRKKSKDRTSAGGSQQSSHEQSPEAYFIPPKDTYRHTEEERRYSRELPNDRIQYSNDDHNKAKNHLFDKPDLNKTIHKDLRTITQGTRGAMDKEIIKQTLTDLTLDEQDKIQNKSKNTNKVDLDAPLSKRSTDIQKFLISDFENVNGENQNEIDKLGLRTNFEIGIGNEKHDDKKLKKLPASLNTQLSQETIDVTADSQIKLDKAKTDKTVSSSEKESCSNLDAPMLTDSIVKGNTGLLSQTETLKSEESKPVEIDNFCDNDVLKNELTDTKYKHSISLHKTDEKGVNPHTTTEFKNQNCSKENLGLRPQTETSKIEKSEMDKSNDSYINEILDEGKEQNKYNIIVGAPLLDANKSSQFSDPVMDKHKENEKSNDTVVIIPCATTASKLDHNIKKKNPETVSLTETLKTVKSSNELYASEILDDGQSGNYYNHSLQIDKRDAKDEGNVFNLPLPTTKLSLPTDKMNLGGLIQDAETLRTRQSKADEFNHFYVNDVTGNTHGKREEQKICTVSAAKSSINQTSQESIHEAPNTEHIETKIPLTTVFVGSSLQDNTNNKNKLTPDVSHNTIPYKNMNDRAVDEFPREFSTLEKPREQALHDPHVKGSGISDEAIYYLNKDTDAAQNNEKAAHEPSQDKKDLTNITEIDQHEENSQTKTGSHVLGLQKPVQDFSFTKTTPKTEICDKPNDILDNYGIKNNNFKNYASMETAPKQLNECQNLQMPITKEKNLDNAENYEDTVQKVIFIEKSSDVKSIPLLQTLDSQDMKDEQSKTIKVITPKSNTGEEIEKETILNSVAPVTTRKDVKSKLHDATDLHKTNTSIRPVQPLIQDQQKRKTSTHSITSNVQNSDDLNDYKDNESIKSKNKDTDTFTTDYTYTKNKKSYESIHRSASKTKSVPEAISKINTDQIQPKKLSQQSVLSENKEFATSSTHSIDSHENFTTVNNIESNQERIIDYEDKESPILNVISTKAKDVAKENTLPRNINIFPYQDNQDKIPGAILRKASFQGTEASGLHNDEVTINPFKRHTFTIVESNSTLQKNVEEISAQPNITAELSNLEDDKTISHVETLQSSEFLNAKTKQLASIHPNAGLEQKNGELPKALTSDTKGSLDTKETDGLKQGANYITEEDWESTPPNKDFNKSVIESHEISGEQKLFRISDGENDINNDITDKNKVNKDDISDPQFINNASEATENTNVRHDPFNDLKEMPELNNQDYMNKNDQYTSSSDKYYPDNKQPIKNALKSTQNVDLDDDIRDVADFKKHKSFDDENYEGNGFSDKYSPKLELSKKMSNVDKERNDVLSNISQLSETDLRRSEDSHVSPINKQQHSKSPTQSDKIYLKKKSLLDTTTFLISDKVAVTSKRTMEMDPIIPDTYDSKAVVNHGRINDKAGNYPIESGQEWMDGMNKKLPSILEPFEDYGKKIQPKSDINNVNYNPTKNSAPLFGEKENTEVKSSSFYEQAVDTENPKYRKSYDYDNLKEKSDSETNNDITQFKDKAQLLRKDVDEKNLAKELNSSYRQQAFDKGYQKDVILYEKETNQEIGKGLTGDKNEFQFLPEVVKEDHVEYHPISKLPFFNYDPSYFDVDINVNPNIVSADKVSDQIKLTCNEEDIEIKKLNKIDNKQYPDYRIPISKEKNQREAVLLNLSFQSYLNDNNEMVVQTLSPQEEPKRRKYDTITVVQSLIRHGNEIRIPVSLENDITLNFVHKHSDDFKNVDANRNNLNQTHAFNQQTSNKHEDVFNKNLAAIYEKGLVPLHKVIKGLAEEVEMLSSQQEMFREKLRATKRTKSLRLIPVKRCGCRKM